MTLLKQFLLSSSLLSISFISSAADIVVDDPYVREVPPGQPNSAAFMTIRNTTDKDIALIQGISDAAKTIEVHEHVHEDGMMKMRQVPKIIIPAQGETMLKPGGYHIMFINLTQKLKAGNNVNLELVFDNGQSLPLTAKVRKVDVKKLMKNRMANIKKVNKHTHPTPNLLSVYKMMGDKLNLSDEQKAELDAGIKKRGPKAKQMIASIMKIEAQIHKAYLDNATTEEIDQLSADLMRQRSALITGKLSCRESVKKTLDQAQFDNLLSLYQGMVKANKKSAMNDKAKKMAMLKHANPTPNLMQVIKKIGDQLALTELQQADLKEWRENNGPKASADYKLVAKLDKEIHQAALAGESKGTILETADQLMQTRVRIIRRKTLCRDNMQRILNQEQYEKLIQQARQQKQL